MINAILASFGGGLLGALLGGLPSFVICGVLCIAGCISGNALFGAIAFGPFFAPCISFCGGAAASAYAARKGLIENGQSLDSTFGTGAPDTLLVGGVFGILGYLLNYLFADVLKLHTDTIALAVVISGFIARLAFGKTGLFGKFDSGEKRTIVTPGKGLVMNLVVGLGIGLLVGLGYTALDAEWAAANYQTLMFGIAAFSLVFASMGKASPGFHHVIAPAAGAAIMLGPWAGVAFAVIGSLLGDILGNLYNNGKCDSHIDPPGGAIFIQMWIINLLAGNGFAG